MLFCTGPCDQARLRHEPPDRKTKPNGLLIAVLTATLSANPTTYLGQVTT